MTSFFAWIMRGFNMTRKHRALKEWIQAAKPSFGCLLETRVQEIDQRILSVYIGSIALHFGIAITHKNKFI